MGAYPVYDVSRVNTEHPDASWHRPGFAFQLSTAFYRAASKPPVRGRGLQHHLKTLQLRLAPGKCPYVPIGWRTNIITGFRLLTGDFLTIL